MEDDALARVRNKEIGFVFQQFNLMPRLSCAGKRSGPLIYAGINQERTGRQSPFMLERVGLGQRYKHKPNELSGGSVSVWLLPAPWSMTLP